MCTLFLLQNKQWRRWRLFFKGGWLFRRVMRLVNRLKVFSATTCLPLVSTHNAEVSTISEVENKKHIKSIKNKVWLWHTRKFNIRLRISSFFHQQALKNVFRIVDCLKFVFKVAIKAEPEQLFLCNSPPLRIEVSPEIF